MKKIKLITYAASVLLLSVCVNGCTKTTDNSTPPPSNTTVSNNPAPPDTNAGSPNVTTANSSASPLAPPPVAGIPPENSAKSKQPTTAVGKPPERVIGSGGNDFYLFSKIHGELSQDEQLKNSNIIVNINAGMVTLTGTVANAEQKARAEQLAHGVEGVKGIKNQLRIAASNAKS
jgi:hyperosmotically inducible protein